MWELLRLIAVERSGPAKWTQVIVSPHGPSFLMQRASLTHPDLVKAMVAASRDEYLKALVGF